MCNHYCDVCDTLITHISLCHMQRVYRISKEKFKCKCLYLISGPIAPILNLVLLNDPIFRDIA